MRLGCLKVKDAFHKKLQRMKQSRVEEDIHNSVDENEHYEDAVRDKYVVESTKDVKIGLKARSMELAHRLLNRFATLFNPVTRSATKYSHRIQLTDNTP